jgi:hypothetical protein
MQTIFVSLPSVVLPRLKGFMPMQGKRDDYSKSKEV